MIKTIIVEDEQQSRELLELMLEKYNDVITVTDTCATPAKAIESITKHAPDLVFLDIEMPKMSGFDMLKKIGDFNFNVIFTTAYNKYAINAIKINAMDYLMKPIDDEELGKAIQKCQLDLEHKKTNQKMDALFKNMGKQHSLDTTLTLSSLDGTRFIKMKDILRLEASGRYTKFYLVNKEVLIASRTIGDFEKALINHDFFRIHESHIVNLYFIDRFYKGNNFVLLTDKTELPLARRRKEEFLKIIPKI
ncbi:MAG TPA: LytTR family DNA-binding domain-containing protein [Hanamia sp.]